MTSRIVLSLAVALACGLAGCKPATPAADAPSPAVPAQAAHRPAVGEPGYAPPDAEDGPMECLAYIDLLRQAIKDGKATGDEAALKAASAAARAEAHKGRTDDEVAQYYASSVAVFDDLAVSELQRKSAACIAHPPAQPAF
jgi:hypothetical protein